MTKEQLTKKQQTILNHLSDGETPGEVAKRLGISVNGIYGHMRRVEAKGYKVPRSGRRGRPQRQAAAPRASKPESNGTSPSDVEGTIEEGIEKLISFAEEERKRIDKEIAEKDERRSVLDQEIDVLRQEGEVLAQRHTALNEARR